MLPITHKDMTRFWITLNQGVDFVINCFERMQGGEIFVPKIPSVRIVELAKAMGPGLKQEFVGLRPGEKIHESLCSADESHLVMEFGDYFVVQPAIRYLDSELFSGKVNFLKNMEASSGKPVSYGFDYNSGTNTKFLSKNELTQVYGVTGM